MGLIMRIREPFYSVLKKLNNEFTLNDFVSYTKVFGTGYNDLSDEDVRKIVYRQIVRLKKNKMISSTSRKNTINPSFEKITDCDKNLEVLTGCNMFPLLDQEYEHEDSEHDPAIYSRVSEQMAVLQSKKTELIGEAEGYELIATIIPDIEDVISQQKKKITTEQDKLNGMINAFAHTINTLRHGEQHK